LHDALPILNARGRSTLRFNGSRCASYVRLGLRSLSRTSASLLGTGSRRSRVIAPDSIASGSTTSGASASCGPTLDRRRWRHPGEVLMEDFIEGFGITQHKLAVSIGVPLRRINEIVHGKRGGYRGHRTASREVLRDLGGVLDQSAEPLRA